MAADNGWTAWAPAAPGTSYSTFFKDAATRVYQERIETNIAGRYDSASSPSGPAHGQHPNARPERTQAPLSPPPDAPSTNSSISISEMASTRGQGVIGESLVPKPVSQVVDPVDRAIWQMVGMGFPVAQARKALAMTDTGSNLNVAGAIELCLRWGEEMRSPLGPSGDLSGSGRNPTPTSSSATAHPSDGPFTGMVAAP